MAGSFPLVINEQSFSSQTLSGKKYVRTYPDLLSAVVQQASPIKWYTLYCTLLRAFYPRYGEFTFSLSPNKAAKVGMVYRAYATTGSFNGIVKSYDRDTGLAVLLIEAFSPEPLSGVMTLEMTAAYYAPVLSAPLAVTSGGTGESTVLGALEAAGLSHPSFSSEEIFDDFSSFLPVQAASVTPYPWDVVISGTGTFDQYPGTAGSAPDNNAQLETRSGVLELKVTANGDLVSLVRGQETFHFDGPSVIFIASVLIPSTGTNIRFTIGLKGQGSSDSEHTDHSGVVFSYSSAAHAGNWGIDAAVGGSTTSYDSGVAVASAQWYELMFEYDGSEVICYIDGTDVKHLTLAEVPETGVANLMALAISLRRTSSSGAKSAFIDYIYRSKKVTR